MIELNTIYNEDCFVGLRKMNDNSVDHVITSPPYNRKRNDKYNNYDDDVDDYYEFMKRSIDESLRVSRGYVFFNIQKNYYNKQDVFKLIGEYSEKIIDIIIWNKSNPMPASGSNITNAYEFILVLSNNMTSLKSNSTYTKNAVTTNVYSDNPFKKVHRAVMNPEVCYWMIDKFTQRGEIILDIFSGMGTTALCSKERDRQYIGFELDETYHKLSLERIESHTQKLSLNEPEQITMW